MLEAQPTRIITQVTQNMAVLVSAAQANIGDTIMLEAQSTRIIAQVTQNMAALVSAAQANTGDTITTKNAYEHTTSSNFSFWPFFGSLRYRTKLRKIHNNPHREFTVVYHLPPWLSDHALEWNQFTRYSGWRTNLSTYRILSSHSLLFTFAGTGRVQDIQLLFSSKMAFVDDHSEAGLTALHVWIMSFLISVIL